MSRYIRYKYQKQQINFMNCCDIDDWVDTNNKRITGFDSICGNKDYDFYGNNKTYIKVQLNDQWRDIETPPQWYQGWANPVKIYFESFSNIGVPNSISRMRVYVYGYDMMIAYGSDGETDKDFLIIGERNQDLSIYDSKTILETDNVTKYSSSDTTQNHHLKTTSQSGTKGSGSTNEEYFIDFVYVKNGDTNVGEDRAYVTLYLPDNFTGSLKKCDCNEVWENEPEVMTRTKKLNPNYEYECIDGNRHYRLQVQESYDKGASWVDTQRFELGDVYEENSEWCNATEIKFKWEYYNEIIKGFEKIINWIKKFSLDGGETWDYLTYIDDNGEVIYEYKQTAMNIDGCGRHSDIEYQISATDTYIGACSTSAVPIVKARYKTGKLCCIEQNIIWGDWGDWFRLDIDTDFTVDMPTIEKNETNREKIYEYTVQGIGVYGSLSATGRIIQEAGPCTPIPDEPDEPTPEPEPENDFDGDIIYTFIEKNIAVDGRNKPTSIQINGDWYYISTCRKYDGYADEYIAKEYLKNCISPQWTTIRWPRFSKHLVRLIKLPVQKELQKDNCYLYELISTFYECEIAEDLYLKDWDTSRVWNACSCFYNCKKLPKLDLSGWNTTSLSRAKEIFYGCSSLTEIDVSSWDISNLMTSAPTWYSKMFTGCSKLKTLYVKDNVAWWTERLKDCGVGGCKVIVK